MIMLISSSRGQNGDRAYFESPLKLEEKPMKLSFYLFKNATKTDNVSQFEIYRTENGVMTDLLYRDADAHHDWRLQSIVLPAGVYSLTMVGVMGQPFKSDIGLASITLSDTNENPNVTGLL